MSAATDTFAGVDAPETVGDAVVVARTDAMDRAEWLGARRRGIGGSDAAVICGLDDHTSPYELWCEKALGDIDDDDSEAALWGRILEPVVASEVARRTGAVIDPVRAILAHPTRSWQLANIDGTARHPHRSGPGNYEGKTASLRYADQWADDQVPDRYVVQGQHYLAVTGWDWVIYGCLIGGQRLVVRYVERDQALIDQLIELEARFWEQVIERTPPAPDGSKACTEFLNQIQATKGKTVTVDPDVTETLLARRALAAEQIKAAEEEKASAENQLKALLGDAEIGVTPDGRPLVTWKEQTRRGVDAELVRRAGPFLDEIATLSRFRVLRTAPKPKTRRKKENA